MYAKEAFCAVVLAEDAIRSAIRDYRSKRANRTDSKQATIDVSQPIAETATASSPSQA
jgi:hypothetical protein